MDHVAPTQESPLRAADALARLRRRLLRAAGRWFPSLSPGDLEDVVQSAWLSAARTESGVEHLEKYLFEAVHTQGLMELRRRRRHASESLDALGASGEGGERRSDGRPVMELTDPSPEEQLETRFLGRLVSEMLDELPVRQRQVVKLRWGWGLSREEIAAALGISVRRVKRDLRQASIVLEAQSELVRAGGWCDSKRSLVTAYALGWLGPTRAAMARRHLEICPGCRALVLEQRARAEELVALLPAPAVACPGSGSWGDSLAVVDAVRERLSDLVAGAKQQAVLASSRAADVSPLAGARPGSVAVVAAGCIAATGGAYCAVEGVPGLMVSRLAADHPQVAGERKIERRKVAKAQSPDPPVVATIAQDQAAAPPAEPAAQTPRSKAPERERPVTAATAQEEFFGQSQQQPQQTGVAEASAAAAGSSTATSSPPAPARVPAPATERGEFGGP